MTKRIDEQQITDLMKESKLELSVEFESTLMNKIYRHSSRKKQLYMNLKLSCAFLALGIAAGIFVNKQIPSSDAITVGLASKDFLLAFQILFVGICLTQLDTVFQQISKLKSS